LILAQKKNKEQSLIQLKAEKDQYNHKVEMKLKESSRIDGNIPQQVETRSKQQRMIKKSLAQTGHATKLQEPPEM
jgi:type II secretory pathway component PulM